MTSRWHISDLGPEHHTDVQALILAGLAEHWGRVDPTLNPDLDDLVAAYGHGRTIVLHHGTDLVGTGTVVPRPDGSAEIVRMSVSRAARRLGVGRRIVEELVATARGWNAGRVVLETTSAWGEVVSFYLSCGFVVTHTADSAFGQNTWFEVQLEPGG